MNLIFECQFFQPKSDFYFFVYSSWYLWIELNFFSFIFFSTYFRKIFFLVNLVI